MLTNSNHKIFLIQVKLELDLARMRRDLAEKDNIIEEKAEEMYMLNEKVEQQVNFASFCYFYLSEIFLDKQNFIDFVYS